MTDEDKSYRAAADQLRQYVESYERNEEEKKALSEHGRDIMSEAKANGYDTRALKKLIALRKRDKNDVAEEEAVLEMYRKILGM